MYKGIYLVILLFASFAFSSELEENEQKKRGAGKGANLNSIPSGVQKPEYTYNIYPTPQSPQATQYQAQIPNSFYPSQSNQYYASPNDGQYTQQPQINLIPPPNSSPFGPFNFLQNAGFQSRIQLVPSKGPNGNIQLAIVQQPIQPNIVPYPHLYAANPNQQQLVQAQSNFAPNYQSLINSPYGQPSTMLLLAQPNQLLYNNMFYQNPGQSLYGYNPPNQARYVSYGGQPSQAESQSAPQISPKDDNEISGHNNEYSLTPPDAPSYKSYSSRSAPYSKL